MTGVFRCTSCSKYFPEAVPPLWLEYWPNHCGEPAFLDHLEAQRALQPTPRKSRGQLHKLVTTASLNVLRAMPLVLLVPGFFFA